MKNLARLWRTLVHLRPRQIVFQAYYRLTGKLTRSGARPRVQGPVEAPGPGHSAAQAGASSAGGQIPRVFTFLNRTVEFSSAINWNYAEEGKLWTYHLNYCEVLQYLDYPTGLALIHDWIGQEASHRDGWEPYPLSLRLGYWQDFFQRHGRPVPDEVRASILRQYLSLSEKIEYHLGGNHLLENAIALTRTALFLGRWRQADRYAALLERTHAEQYLADGMHFELSPAYHFIMLDRWLNFYQAVQPRLAPHLSTVPAPAPPVDLPAAPHLLDNLRNSLQRQLAWTQNFVTADGRYAYFNDATPGMAPSPLELLRRSAKLSLFPTRNLPLGASGYRRWSVGHADCWVDAAMIGPDHIPGHAHADNLSFVLHLHGRPLLVDPAVSTYEKNARRAWERSTAAHNTVTVGGEDSSETWGGFRVGRRAKTVVINEFGTTISMRHDGYPVTHKRQLNLNGELLTIIDELGNDAEGTARFHFDHRLSVELFAGRAVFGAGVINWRGARAELRYYDQATGWNETRPAQVLCLTFTGRLDTRVQFSRESDR